MTMNTFKSCINTRNTVCETTAKALDYRYSYTKFLLYCSPCCVYFSRVSQNFASVWIFLTLSHNHERGRPHFTQAIKFLRLINRDFQNMSLFSHECFTVIKEQFIYFFLCDVAYHMPCYLGHNTFVRMHTATGSVV